MFLKNPKLLFKSSSFRLITWYTVLFILSSLIINVYAYTVISKYIYEQSRGEIFEDMDELQLLYKDEGFEALYEDVFEDEYESLFHRVVNAEGLTTLVRVPPDWEEFDIDQLDSTQKPIEGEWIYLAGDEEKYEVLTGMLFDDSIIQLGQNTEHREDLLAKIRKVYLFTIIPIIFLAYLGGVFIADRALSPIRRLINTLNSIVSGAKIDVRVPVENDDKFNNDLIILFNSMLDKIEALINGMRNILDNVAHDLRTPMTRLRGTAELALGSEDNNESLRDALIDCVEESERVILTLNTLMDVSEAETGALKLNPEKLNITENNK